MRTPTTYITAAFLLLLSACGAGRPANCLLASGCGGGSSVPVSGIQSVSPALQSDFALLSGVVLGAEYGGGNTVVRWTHSPTLSFFNATSLQKQYANAALAQVNYAIRYSGIQVQVVADNQMSADIKVAFGPASQMSQMGDYFGIDYVEGNSGFFWTHNDAVGRILDGVVLIQSDIGSDLVLRHTLLEELTQVMGPMRDQALYEDSVYYEKNGVSGVVTQLSQIDARIVAFLYMYLEPGDTLEDVLQKFVAIWKTPVT
ncbi:MAG: DUF2927 domain-containing protein [Bdellovibrionales bacterium]|nr:DUF2927 domain-containing protein [Bdellovibrionales bacterium]